MLHGRAPYRNNCCRGGRFIYTSTFRRCVTIANHPNDVGRSRSGINQETLMDRPWIGRFEHATPSYD
eukprot:12888013-Prorocentrum_lima.AAC.1